MTNYAPIPIEGLDELDIITRESGETLVVITILHPKNTNVQQLELERQSGG